MKNKKKFNFGKILFAVLISLTVMLGGFAGKKLNDFDVAVKGGSVKFKVADFHNGMRSKSDTGSKTIIDHDYNIPIKLQIKEDKPGCSDEPQEFSLSVNVKVKIYYDTDTGEFRFQVVDYNYSFVWGTKGLQQKE